MSRLTYENQDGTWGLMNGYDMQKIPSELYGALCKLKDYEETGYEIEELERQKCKFEYIEELEKIAKNLEEYKVGELSTKQKRKEIAEHYREIICSGSYPALARAIFNPFGKSRLILKVIKKIIRD